MSAESGSGLGTGGGIPSGGSVAVASPEVSTPSMGIGGERGFAPISISNAKGEVTFGKAEHTFTFGKATSNHLTYAAVTKGMDRNSPIPSTDSISPIKTTQQTTVEEQNNVPQAQIEPLSDESKAELHDDISAFLRGEAKPANPEDQPEAPETDIQVMPDVPTDLDAGISIDVDLEPYHSEGRNDVETSKTQDRGEVPQALQSETAEQAVAELVTNPEASKDNEVKVAFEVVGKTEANSQASEHQDAVHEVVSSYVKEYVEPKVAPSESTRQAAVELMLHQEDVKTDGKDGLIKKDATLAAGELNRNAERAVKVIEIADAYYASLDQLTPEQKAKNRELGIRSLHLANVLSGTEDATKEAYKKTLEIRSHVSTDTSQESSSEAVRQTDIDGENVQTTAQPDGDRETIQGTTLEQSIIDNEVVTNESLGETVVTTIQDRIIREEHITAKVVRDEQTNELRRKTAESIGVTIFEYQKDAPAKGVDGSLIARNMPEIDPPKPYISEMLQGSEAAKVVDGSWLQFYADIYNAGELTSVSQISRTAKSAADENTAIKVVEETTVTEREATDEEIENVFNKNTRYKKARGYQKAA